MNKFLTLLILVGATSCISDSARPYDTFVKEFENLPDARIQDQGSSDAGKDLEDAGMDLNIPDIPQICTEDGGEFVRVRFFNLTGQEGKVSRIKSSCDSEFVTDLDTVERPFQDSFVGEVWSFSNNEGIELSRLRILDPLTVRVNFEVPE